MRDVVFLFENKDVVVFDYRLFGVIDVFKCWFIEILNLDVFWFGNK